MSRLGSSKVFPPVLVLAICTGAALAQPLVQPKDGQARDTARLVVPSYSATRNPRVSVGKPDSWWWVHAGVTAELAGTFGDWATSWKQPEGNSLLAQSGGQYAGKFYRTGTVMKFSLTAGVTVVSYAIAWKWPKARKFVGVFNMTMGGGFTVQAIRNAAVNPYYKP